MSDVASSDLGYRAGNTLEVSDVPALCFSVHCPTRSRSSRLAAPHTALRTRPLSLALARKYRPKKFADVAVQSHVSSTLKGAIARGRVAHGYLLCGPRGVGKTTLARVLAMALNCERRADPSLDGEPCGECTSCTRIWTFWRSHAQSLWQHRP